MAITLSYKSVFLSCLAIFIILIPKKNSERFQWGIYFQRFNSDWISDEKQWKLCQCYFSRLYGWKKACLKYGWKLFHFCTTLSHQEIISFAWLSSHFVTKDVFEHFKFRNASFIRRSWTRKLYEWVQVTLIYISPCYLLYPWLRYPSISEFR